MHFLRMRCVLIKYSHVKLVFFYFMQMQEIYKTFIALHIVWNANTNTYILTIATHDLR